MEITTRISVLREWMKTEGIDACIIPTTDPHISEYTASHWETRKWISGFTGSAGTVVISAEKAGLWTDSRYFIQAENQLLGSGILLFKEGLPDTLSIKEWLISELPQGSCIGIDGKVYTASEAMILVNFFTEKNRHINTGVDPAESCWKNRPEIPANKTFLLPEHFSGKSARIKIEQVLQAIHQEGATAMILASLDMIAWLFNLRGNDVDFNPVTISYAVVSDKETVLFIKPQKLSAEVIDYLKNQGLILADYEKILDYVKQLPETEKIIINPTKINYQLLCAIPSKCKVINASIHPVDLLKSIKNEIEITGIRQTMKKDGLALVKFQCWLEESLENKQTFTELDISQKLREFRGEQAYYVGESFDTIAGYAAHGAIVHYSASHESNAVIQNEGLLLVDSGAQYFDGTTDITRTFAVGAVTEQMKTDYTLVLKGHIALAKAQFPQGTKGVQLDVLARQALWERGINYLHGTGHGVGHFLNVHEGPQSIRMDLNPTVLQPGMVLSNEPGLYRANSHGIRIENLMLVTEAEKTEFGIFYRFETLTLCPIDKKPIDKSLLSTAEINWFNTYHQQVFERLAPLLTEKEKTWLKEKTSEL